MLGPWMEVHELRQAGDDELKEPRSKVEHLHATFPLQRVVVAPVSPARVFLVPRVHRHQCPETTAISAPPVLLPW